MRRGRDSTGGVRRPAECGQAGPRQRGHRATATEASARGKPDEPERRPRWRERPEGVVRRPEAATLRDSRVWAGPAIGGRYAAGGREAGAVTPGIASIGRTSGLGIAGRAARRRASDRRAWKSRPSGRPGRHSPRAARALAVRAAAAPGRRPRPPMLRNRYSDRTVTSLDIAGSRLDTKSRCAGIERLNSLDRPARRHCLPFSLRISPGTPPGLDTNFDCVGSVARWSRLVSIRRVSSPCRHVSVRLDSGRRRSTARRTLRTV